MPQVPQVSQTDPMKEIKDLARGYLALLKQDSWESDQRFLKWVGVEEVITYAKTPEDVIKILSAQHQYYPDSYGNHERRYTRLEVLRFNRTPWPVWFIEAFLVLLTFPFSILFLMYMSWKERETLNFLKTNGSIFVDKLLAIYRREGLPTSVPAPCPAHTTPTEPQHASTLQGNVMHQLTQPVTQPETTHAIPLVSAPPETTHPLPLVSAPFPASQALEGAGASLRTMDADAQAYPTLAEEMRGNENMVGAFKDLFFSNPNTFLDATLSRYTGSPVMIASQPFEPMQNNQFRLTFTYKTLWTDAPPIETSITLFRAFQCPRRDYGTGNEPMQVPRLNSSQTAQWVSSLVSYGCSFFNDDFKATLEKGHEPSLAGDKKKGYYLSALSKAKTEEEMVSALEALIQLAHECIQNCDNELGTHELIKPRLTPRQRQYFESGKEELAREINTYLDKLPRNYLTSSVTARAIQTKFDRIWGHLERNEGEQAYALYKKELEAFKLIDYHAGTYFPPFIIKAFPHLEAMKQQLEAIFFLKGDHDEQGAFLDTTDAIDAHNRMSTVYKRLQDAGLPEATDFYEQTIRPLEEMRSQAKIACQATSKERIQDIAYQERLERLRAVLRRECYHYRTDCPIRKYRPTPGSLPSPIK